MPKPAARVTDPTRCPLHAKTENAIASGSPDVFIDGLPAAREGDTCTCGSTLISEVSSTVLINGKKAALIGTVGTHGNVVIGGSSTVIIGDSHTPATILPSSPLPTQKVYGQSFSITDSETGLPLPSRGYVAIVDGVESNGVTDAHGMVHLKTLNPEAKISLHIKFVAPARTLHELSEES
ncbi:PAAR domain-containing protein [Pseudomonas sp. REP124]|uniref:PAAR domain-containing protein n=1 Tax=Pseudomonas sp. REP124 TaxID=2875731 RepID=UPI001CCB8C3B|nr:PAAR domain-containing protein [Pseudomonas sp. REP124]MBZ9780221.1 PAAR domain-containing protein [Pseudomonas sp. REP124]